MKATELMIGNWVEQPNTGTEQVVSILNELQIITTSGHIDKYCKPIPLTEEWLIKFGFDNSLVKDIFLALGYNVIYDEGKYYFRYYGLTVEVKHVHQLQNLYFALTNEELTIKL